MTDTVKTEKRTLTSRYNIFREGENIVLEMEMPGVSKDGLDIRVEGDHLLVRGTKEIEPLAGQYKIHEIKDGDFQHVFTIDETVDRNKIEAGIKNGIVTVTLGIRESEKPKKIQIVSK